MGSHVTVCRQNLNVYRDLARSYLKGSLFGVAVLAEQAGELVGFGLAGEDWDEPRLDLDVGKIVHIWILWVREDFRRSGLGLEILNAGLPTILDMGFETAHMTVLNDNLGGDGISLAFGAQPAERVYLCPLGDRKHG